MSEEWRNVSEFTGLYEVSSLGRVRRAASRRLLNPFRHNGGFLYVDLRRDDRTFRRPLHMLVSAAFVPQTLRGTVLAFLSSDKSDCSATNLAWRTPSERKRQTFRADQVGRDEDGRFSGMAAAIREIEAAAMAETAKGWR